MSIDIDNLRKGLWDLKYSRHLQKTHSFFNLGMAFSVGIPAVLVGMKEVGIIALGKDILIYLLFLTFLIPWIAVYPLISQQRRLRKDVTKWIQGLDKSNFFNKN